MTRRHPTTTTRRDPAAPSRRRPGSPSRSRRLLLAVAAGLLVSGACDPGPQILSPTDGSHVLVPETGGVPVDLALGGAFGEGWSFGVTLLAGVDAPPAAFHDLTGDFTESAGSASGELDPSLLVEGRNTLFLGIVPPGATGAATVVSASFSWEPALDVASAAHCDLLDPEICLYPFPNDRFSTDDPATDTGRRIQIPSEGTPANFFGDRVDTTEWNRNDGFSPGQALQTLVPGLVLRTPNPDPDETRPIPAPGASPEWDLAASLAEDANVVILDTETGGRVPHWAELNTRVAAPNQALLIRPARNFRSGGRYVVALRNLRDADGALIPPGRAFRLYRDAIPTFVPEIESRRAHMEEIFATLADHGVPRDDLYLAWDFTVASQRNLSERMVEIRDDAFAKLGDAAPEFVIDEFGPKGDDPEVRYRVRGRVKVPLYVTNDGEPGGGDAATRLNCVDDLGESRVCEGDELPVQVAADPDDPSTWWTDEATYMAEFACTVPRSVQTAEGTAVPARPSLYGHGLLGSEGEAQASHVEVFADEHNFVFCGARWIGMGEDDFLTVAGILGDFSRFPTLPDRMQQGLLNFLFLGRAMIHPDGLGSHPAFQADDGTSILDGSELYYDGNSQGAIAGGALAAFAQDYTRAVLGVPGMNYSTLLNRSVDFDQFRQLLAINYQQPRLYPLMFGLAQMLWDRTETNGHANHVTDDPHPGTPPKKILLHVAFGDFQVSDASAQVEARSMGASMHRPGFDPAAFQAYNPDGEPRDFWQVNPYWDIPGIPSSDPGPPVPGAEDATYRFDGSAMVVWDFGNLQSPNEVFPPAGGNPELGPCPAGRGGDPHECPRRDPRALIQKSEFLSPDGAVLDVCGGQACVGPPPAP